MPISEERLRKEIEDLSNLPTLPGVVHLIATMVEEEDTNVQQVGDMISRDHVLSARLLRLVNSPFYGFPGRISSIRHALVLLGFNVVKGLVLSTTVFDQLAKEARGLWEHSLGTALLSRRMARELNLREPDEILVAGLLHDLGKVVLAHIVPREYDRVFRIARERRVHIAVAELEVFGFDHCAVAGWVAAHWHLPERLNNALSFHHAPAQVKNSPETAVVHLADILARGMSYGDGGDPTMPPIDHKAFRDLGLTFEQIDGVLKATESEYNSGLNVFTEGK